MSTFFRKHWEQWLNVSFVFSVVEGAFLLAGGIAVNHFASAYADLWAGNSVADMFLDNLPVTDVDGILEYGALLLGAFLIVICLVLPQRIPFVLKGIALFVLIRSGFIILTHLGPSPEKTPIDDAFLFSSLLSGNDLFFSGHTGFPFLMALIFWDRVIARGVFLVFTFVFAAAVLLGHLHYSIDVFSAFFITYSILQLARFLFERDWKRCHDS